ncbi:MAG TPA: trypsin-like peptidase domain-containing protein [Anaerolineaceae bacterium]|nr:trypsin-like peptidase domain-containing protein [Anaerolineaceae bacterium]
MNGSINENPAGLKRRLRQAVVRSKRAIPFASGVAAALLALLIYNLLTPAPDTLTIGEVNDTINQVMGSATPAPAYSAQVYQQIQPSLVLIQSTHSISTDIQERSLGSGVIVTDAGEILTALHVVEQASEIQVTFANGAQSTAQVVASQPENDIAVLQADQPPEPIYPAVLGNPNAMSIGDEAYAVGNPYGLYGSMSAGVISGFERSFTSPTTGESIDGLIQIDTAVNPGNSGGPLLNRAGHVIGIVVGILNPTEQEVFIGIGFAVPIQVAGGALGSAPY